MVQEGKPLIFFKMQTEFLKSFAEVRSKAYWFLSELYMEKPDKGLLKNLREKLPKVIKSLEYEPLKAEFELLGNFLLKGDQEKIEMELAIEFTRLFRGIKKGYSPPPPYESVYMGEDRVMGETTLRVMDFYRKAGFGIIDEREGPQDYIGVELKFMSLLAYKEMMAWRKENREEALNYLKLQVEFLEEHLLKWVPEFCRVVERNAKVEFYAIISRITKEIISSDHENLKSLFNEIKNRPNF